MGGGYYDDEDEEGGWRKWLWWVVAGVVAVGLGVGVYFVATRNSDPSTTSARPSTTGSPDVAVATTDAATTPETAGGGETDTSDGTGSSPDASGPGASTPTSPAVASPTVASPTSAAEEVTTTIAQVSQLPPVAPTTTEQTQATSTTDAPTPAVTAADVPSPATTLPAQAGPVPTLPDGSPVPIVAVFDTDQIVLTGAVPSQAAIDRLDALAVANSKTPAVPVNNLVINPAVPINVGVRVIELNSVRFPESSAIVGWDHAIELNRVVNIMKALPNVSCLVVGHADQRGNEVKNFAISDARARAVVSYLIGAGVPAERLSSRAVGATDLLSIDDDDVALALNRRTEFIFYGLLIES